MLARVEEVPPTLSGYTATEAALRTVIQQGLLGQIEGAEEAAARYEMELDRQCLQVDWRRGGHLPTMLNDGKRWIIYWWTHDKPALHPGKRLGQVVWAKVEGIEPKLGVAPDFELTKRVGWLWNRRFGISRRNMGHNLLWAAAPLATGIASATAWYPCPNRTYLTTRSWATTGGFLRWVRFIVARNIQAMAEGPYPPCDPSCWWCDKHWCDWIGACRGKSKVTK